MEMLEYFQDGANYQAKAVLCFLQGLYHIEESWDNDLKEYQAKMQIARWENCREQGYVVYLKSRDYNRQLNIIFFEHRNSDSICAVKWEQKSINALNIDSAKFGDVYQDKYDTSFTVNCYEAKKMADWIKKQLVDFWIETTTK